MRRKSVLAVALAAFLLLAAVPAPVAAETRTGGSVVVGQNETVSEDLTAVGGTVVIRGTVEGDLTAFAGNVLVADTATVRGNVETAAGNVRIEGNVTGDVEAGTGNIVVGESGTVGGSLSASAGYAQLDGTVRGDVRVAGERFRIGPSAVVNGDVVYDVETFDRAPGARITGAVREDQSLFDDGGPAPGPTPPTPDGTGVLFGLATNLLLGAALLVVLPRFSADVAARATDDPLRSAGVGLLAFVAVPILLVLLAITIVGIPLSLAGAIAYALTLWVAAVYGMYAVGVWGLSLADGESKWVALVLGVAAVSLVGLIPILGAFVQFLVLLLGFGALTRAARRRYRGRRAPRREAGAETRDGSDTTL